MAGYEWFWVVIRGYWRSLVVKGLFIDDGVFMGSKGMVMGGSGLVMSGYGWLSVVIGGYWWLLVVKGVFY